MRNIRYFLVMVVIATMFLISCNPKPEPLRSGVSSGASLQDTILPKVLFKLVHEGSSYYFAYYYTNSLVVDNTSSPPTLTLAAQSAKYDATNASSVLHNGSTTSQISSAVSVNTDTVSAVYAGPFDIVNGRIYSVKGYLHYVYPLTAGSYDSCICAIATVVYYNQNTSGGTMAIGYVSQNDLHSPAPPSHQ